MSLTKSAAIRRLSLLAGSSFAAAGLATAVSLGAAMTPAAAWAGVNECGDPVLNAGDDVFTCPTGSVPTGIIYDATSGDLTLTVPGAINIGADTIRMHASPGDDNLTLNLQGAVTVGAAPAVPVVDMLSDEGDITLTMGQITRSPSSAVRQSPVKAISTGGGNVTLNLSGSISTGTGGLYAVEARSSGGGGKVTVNLNSGSLSGTARGLYTNTNGGTGETEINVAGGGAGIMEVVTGTGALTVNFNTGSAARTMINAGGNAVINIAAGFTKDAGATQAGLELTAAAGTTTVVNNLGRLGSNQQGGVTNGQYKAIALTGAGAGRIDVDSENWIAGRLLFTNSGGSLISIADGARWRTNGDNSFGAGGDTISIAARGVFGTGTGQEVAGFDSSRIDFGAGTNIVENGGVFIVSTTGTTSNRTNPNPVNAPSEVRLLHLTEFNNSGTILLGGTLGASDTILYANSARGQTVGDFAGTDGVLAQASDIWADDILSMPGATFTGSPGSRIVFDVNLMGSQAACDPALRGTSDDLVADCLRIEDGATAGITQVTVVDVFSGDRGIYNPEGVTLIDVNGGTSAAEHFIIDPLSSSYSAAFGGVIDKGAFFYPLVYDEATQRHKLVGLVSGNAAQLPLLASAAHSLWRVSAGSWLERQADLRGGFDDRSEGGVWLRINSEFADRDSAYSTGAYGTTFDFDNSYSQTSYAVTGGFDLISGGEGDTAYVAGLMAGYSHADIDFDASSNTGELDGWTGGAYASLVSGGLFVDAVINANKADLKNDIPSLALFPSGTILDTHLLSVGGQVEAGWRIPMAGGFFVEPLAGVSYVRTTYDELDIPAGDPAGPRIDIEFDDPTSLRAGIGGRVGLDQDFGGLRAQFSGLVKVWNEFDGETVVTLHNVGADPTVADDFSGQFTEVGLGASLYSAGGVVSAFLNLGGKFGDDYQATTASAGLRVAF